MKHTAPESQPCKWCDERHMKPRFLDDDGCTVEASSDSGVYILSHAYEDSWWPCLASDQEIRIYIDRGADLHEERVKLAWDKAIEIVNEKLVGNRGMFTLAGDVVDALESARREMVLTRARKVQESDKLREDKVDTGDHYHNPSKPCSVCGDKG